jgi:hypothetical protein
VPTHRPDATNPAHTDGLPHRLAPRSADRGSCPPSPRADTVVSGRGEPPSYTPSRRPGGLALAVIRMTGGAAPSTRVLASSYQMVPSFCFSRWPMGHRLMILPALSCAACRAAHTVPLRDRR